MSDYIPFEIQVHIIKKLPVKSLLQFRLVSKSWKALIDSSEFISSYDVRHLEPPRLLIRYKDQPGDRDEKYVSFIDHLHLTREHFPLTVPELTKQLMYSRFVGSSCGLLCMYGYYENSSRSHFCSGIEMTVIWNPSIRKCVGVEVPDVFSLPFETTVGFGVCPITSDPTLVKISHVGMFGEMFNWPTYPWQVKVFTLSSGTWRVRSTNMPRDSIKLRWSQVVIGRFIYWSGYERHVNSDGGFRGSNLIVSFDITSHEFEVLDLPICLTQRFDLNMSVSKIRESLAVVSYRAENAIQILDVWIHGYGVTESFIKVFTMNTPYGPIKTLGFRKNGEPIVETQFGRDEYATLSYAVSSDDINDMEIYGAYGSYFMSSYMETLVLLNQQDGRIYFNIN